MYWPAGLGLIQNALLTALWLALPLLVAIVGGSLAAGVIAGAAGSGDGATLTAPRLLAGALALLFFGAWMLTAAAAYWLALWIGLPDLVR